MLHDGAVLLAIGIGAVVLGAMIQRAEYQIKKYIKSRKAHR